MGKKKKRGQNNTQIICYYCDRTFIDETTLILHQRAKHFKCGECHKKMTTAPSLAVHCTHVHKTVLKGVPGALPGREAIDLEIFGMAGIPEEFGQEEVVPEEPAGLYKEQRAKMARLAAPPSLPAEQPGSLPPPYSHPAYFTPRPQSWQTGPPAVSGGALLFASAGPPYIQPYGPPHYPHMPPHFLPPRPAGFMPPGLPNSMPFGGQLPAMSHALGPPVQPLFPIARAQEAASTFPLHAAPADQGKLQDSASDANVVWAEETMSMEEVRATMTRYRAQ